MSSLDDDENLFLSSACDALRSGDAETALDALGWVDLLDSLDHDSQARRAVFELFRAQGRELASSSALGRLTGHVYRDRLRAEGPVLAAVEHVSARRQNRVMVIAPGAQGVVVIDRPGSGVAIVEMERLVTWPIDIPGFPNLHMIDLDAVDLPLWLAESDALALRDRRIRLGRIAIAHEILGAAESAVGMAVQHAADRKQFGHPIGAFQAVRHLLANAAADCTAVRAVAAQAAEQYPGLNPLQDSIAKAISGRNGRRACERSLQVLGGVGFTTDHDHHRYHSRVLVLDALLGTSASLAHQLAVTLRTSEGAMPDLYQPIVKDSAA